MTLLSLLPVVPLVILVAAAGALLLLHAHDDDAAAPVAGVGMAGAAAAAAMIWPGHGPGGSGLESDGFTSAMAVVLCATASPAVLVARHVRPGRLHLVVILLTVAAALAATGAADLLTTVVALGIVWTGGAFLVGGQADERGFVPIVRFVVMAGGAGALALFGATLTFVSTGATVLGDVRLRIAAASLDPSPLLVAAVALIGAGCAFAMVILPLHATTDEIGVDAAVGSLVAVTATVATVVRLLSTTFDPIRAGWMPVVSTFAGVLMIVGGIGALAQTRLQRAAAWLVLAYAGLVLAAIVPARPAGAEAAVLLMAVWTGAFACALVVRTAVPGRDAPPTIGGLGWRDLRGGLALTASLLTMAGLPPTAGFTARWRLTLALIAEGRWELVLATAFAGLIVLVVCARLVRRIWEPMPGDRRADDVPVRVPVTAIVAAALLVILGLWGAPLMALAARAAASF